MLRAWAPADAPSLAAAWADPEVARWTGVPAARDEAAARRWIEGEGARRRRGLALDLVIDVGGVVAGEVGLVAVDRRSRAAEVGWWVAAPHRRRGLATAALRAVADWATDALDLDLLVARCHPDNPASLKVAGGAGFAPRSRAGEAGGDGMVWCDRRRGGGTVPT